MPETDQTPPPPMRRAELRAGLPASYALAEVSQPAVPHAPLAPPPRIAPRPVLALSPLPPARRFDSGAGPLPAEAFGVGGPLPRLLYPR